MYSSLGSADQWSGATVATGRFDGGQPRKTHAAISRRLYPTASVENAHLVLLLNDLDRERYHVYEEGKPLPPHLPEFEKGVHYESLFEQPRLADSGYLYFDRKVELLSDFFNRDRKHGVHFLRKQIKVYMRNKLGVSMLAFAIH